MHRGASAAAEPSLDTPHSHARAMLRAAAMLERAPHHADARRVLDAGIVALTALLEGDRRPDWAWFEIVLGDDACRLPEALIRAGIALDRPTALALGLETLAWIIFQGCCPSAALADACDAAFAATGDPHWQARIAAVRRQTAPARGPSRTLCALAAEAAA